MNKYLKFFIVVAIFTAAITSCKKKDTDPDPDLSVSVSSLTFAAAGESKTFDIQSNIDWAISGQPEWLTVTPPSSNGAGTVTAVATPNTATDQRTAQLTVTVKGLPPVPVNVTQHAAVSAFVAVSNITGVPATATAGMPLTLTATVAPTNATNKTIVWSVASAESTGATISDGNTLNTEAAGTVTVMATIINGASATTNYTQEFDITVSPVNSNPALPGDFGIEDL